MEFNGDKFESIRYWPNKDLREQFDEGSQYVNEEGETIEEKDGLKDLGVQLSNDLTFSKHNDKTVKNCKKTLGWVMRTFKTRSQHTMKVLWNSLIQSRLDYCSQMWSPCLQSEIAKVEKVQRTFTKRIEGMDKGPGNRIQKVLVRTFNFRL